MQTPRPDRFTYPHGTSDTPEGYPAEKARGGEVVLRKFWMVAIFATGLIGAAVLAFLGAFYG
jgi:hypothetical protein